MSRRLVDGVDIFELLVEDLDILVVHVGGGVVELVDVVDDAVEGVAHGVAVGVESVLANSAVRHGGEVQVLQVGDGLLIEGSHHDEETEGHTLLLALGQKQPRGPSAMTFGLP